MKTGKYIAECQNGHSFVSPFGSSEEAIYIESDVNCEISPILHPDDCTECLNGYFADIDGRDGDGFRDGVGWFNVQCLCGHVYYAPRGSDLERRCIEREQSGFFDMLILNSDECDICNQDRMIRNILSFGV